MGEPLLGTVLRPTVGKVLPRLFRTRVVGVGNVPAGGAILSGNHVSYADPVLLWCVSPRHTHFMAKAELWEHWLPRWGLPRVWAFPIRRHEADREALGHASDLLKAGELVGIFPEGTRTQGGEGEAYGGAAFLAIRNGVPIVPVGIAGTDRILPKGSRLLRFPRVTMVFGTPVDPSGFAEGSRKERVATMTSAVMDSIGDAVRAAKEA